jgi:hypothetical protein
MKTKMFAVFALMLLMFSLMGTAVLAQENTVGSKALEVSNNQSQASTSVFWDKVRLAFTFNDEKKAEINLKIADKRAEKAGQLLEKNMTEEAQKYVEKHDKAINDSEENFDNIATNGDNESVLNALRATVKMQYLLDLHKEKFITVHSEILERQSERMDESKLNHLESAFSKIENKSDEAEARIAQKQENLIARYKVLTGASDEEVQSILDGFRAEFKDTAQQREDRIHEKETSIQNNKDNMNQRFEHNKGLGNKSK